MSSAPVQLHISSEGRRAAAKASGLRTSPIEPTEWSPSSWQTKPIKQAVTYPSLPPVVSALQKLESLPPLVTPHEIMRLREQLAEVAEGKRFLMQGGDCAELFDYCNGEQIDMRIKLLLQMSLVLVWGGGMQVVRVGRMAGQFAKPRSSPTEMVDGKEVPSFRGDNINGFSIDQRTPNPSRLVDSYFHSAATLNHLRAQLSSGIADLHTPFALNLSHVKAEEQRAEYASIVSSITDSLRLLKTVGADTSEKLCTVDIFVSHEGLLLEYEQTLTRLLTDPTSRTGEKRWFNTSAHFLWIGDRTRQLDGAHVEYFRGIANPIGIKVGPSMKPEELGPLLDIVNPNREPGKVTLISRYGASKIKDFLPAHILAVQSSGHKVVWQCDPMHGNTHTDLPSGSKTRSYSAIVSELSQAFAIHAEAGQKLCGIHLELTGEAVTECLGGSEELSDLSGNYRTYCDPRLNARQALDVAFLCAGLMREERE